MAWEERILDEAVQQVKLLQERLRQLKKPSEDVVKAFSKLHESKADVLYRCGRCDGWSSRPVRTYGCEDCEERVTNILPNCHDGDNGMRFELRVARDLVLHGLSPEEVLKGTAYSADWGHREALVTDAKNCDTSQLKGGLLPEEFLRETKQVWSKIGERSSLQDQERRRQEEMRDEEMEFWREADESVHHTAGFSIDDAIDYVSQERWLAKAALQASYGLGKSDDVARLSNAIGATGFERMRVDLKKRKAIWDGLR